MEDREAVDLAADWADISQGLRKDLGHQLFTQWIKPIQLGQLCKEAARSNCSCRPQFLGQLGEGTTISTGSSLAWKIASSAKCATCRSRCIPAAARSPNSICADDDGFGHRAANDADAGDGIDRRRWLYQLSIGLDPTQTFAAFVTGNTNVLAKNAAERMAQGGKAAIQPALSQGRHRAGQDPPDARHRPFDICSAHPRARIFYCSAERFMVEFVQALKSNEMIEFKGRLRGFRPAAGGRYPVHHRQGRARRKNCSTPSMRCWPKASGWYSPPTARRKRWTGWNRACSAACRWGWWPISSPPISNCAGRSSKAS